MSERKISVDVCILVNAAGEFVIADDEELVSERADQEFEDRDSPRRYVQITIRLSPPGDDIPSSQYFTLDLPEGSE